MANPACKRCQAEMVEISDQTRAEIRSKLVPNFKTLVSRATAGWWKTCPSCGVYALGMEMEKGFPIRTAKGGLADIQALAEFSCFQVRIQ